MASSDDEGEVTPSNVSDYKFTTGAEDESISFAKLPVDWSKGDTHDGKQEQIYLSGKTDNGLRKIYVQVTAWKFDLPKEKPEISVLTAQGNWIKLLKPWKPYNDIIRTVLVTLHGLHFAKWNPQQSQKAFWDYLNRTLSMFERRPCVDDVADHIPLITEAIKWDGKLEKSKLLSAFLAEKPWKKKTINEDVRPSFIVDDAHEEEDLGESEKGDEIEDNDSNEGDENEDSDSDESDCFDSVCAICDNGGNLYICDGKCMRSFHATTEGGDDSKCESLGLTDAELEAIKNVPFICDNCKYKQHQCFACGKLGSSDESSNPEVFCCVNGACGYFYHPHCVAALLHPGDNSAREELEKRIADGEPFACPIHKCHVCKELEQRKDIDMQFAVCRRCPKAYHRKCLPREVTSENDTDSEHIQRAWENLIPKRILIYCLDHEIDEEMMTPLRDHIVFPGPRQEKKKMLELETNRSKKLKERGSASAVDPRDRISGKQQKVNTPKGAGLSRKRLEGLPTPSSKKQKLAATTLTRNSCEKLKEYTNDEGESSDDGSYGGTEAETANLRSMTSEHADNVISKKGKPTAETTDNSLTLDTDAKRRVLSLMTTASSMVTLEEVRKRHKPPSTHAPYSKFSSENVTLGKVEGSIQALHAALKKLDEGNVRDAKAVCGNDLLQQVLKWKERLKVYLAPFLHGVRYTSFGRHFTKINKLKEIVDILHWYAQDGDMLVDFCCGSNDFSWLMKKKLDEMGKQCSFKNYDILQAKNDFNFERRDWIKVKKDELPDGSKLIMGLNPPFGVNGGLANRFINKALEFKPKLLILIVPPETQRLDGKEYDLIWEDNQLLAGRSFYLPGSVDINDRQIEDWNITAPVLYLWSSRAYTPKYRAIAKKHNHRSGALMNCILDKTDGELQTTTSATKFDNKTSSGGREDTPGDIPNNLKQKGNEIMSEGEGKETEIISHEEGKDKETMDHQEELPYGINSTPKEETISHSSEAGKSLATLKNTWESNSKSFGGGRGNRKRPASDMFHKDVPSSTRPISSHQFPPEMDDSFNTFPTQHGETPLRFQSERGGYSQGSREAAQFHSEREGHQQLSHSREMSMVPHDRGGGGGYQQLSHGGEMSMVPYEGGGGGYQHPSRRFSPHPSTYARTEHEFSPHQSAYALTEYDKDKYGIGNLVAKYCGNGYGQPPLQASEQRFNHDYPFPAAPLTNEPYSQSHVPFHGGVEPNNWNREVGVPSSYQDTAYLQHYGLRSNSIASSTSNYGEIHTPASQRYAARLHEPIHARMDPTLASPARFSQNRGLPPQPLNHGSLSFARGPYNPPPQQHSKGWLHD